MTTATRTLSNIQVIDDVVPGSGHSVSQTTPAGWAAAQTSCSDGSPVSNIDVAPGETVTCTFSNLSNTAGRIVIVKDTEPERPAGLLVHNGRRSEPRGLRA